jgi:hypothetical protein
VCAAHDSTVGARGGRAAPAVGPMGVRLASDRRGTSSPGADAAAATTATGAPGAVVAASLRAVERLLAAGRAGATMAPDGVAATGQAGPAMARARAAALRRGLGLLRQGDRAGAAAAWREALRADPDNYVIRKQIWAVEHPERFYPTIDWAWQKTQLARERGERR